MSFPNNVPGRIRVTRKRDSVTSRVLLAITSLGGVPFRQIGHSNSIILLVYSVKRSRFILGVILFLVWLSVLFLTWRIQTNPARQPLDKIETELWSLTPKGNSVEQVQMALRAHFGREGKLGYVDLGKKVKIISLDYGQYIELRNFPYETTVVKGYWLFDQEERLKEINVELFVDGP